MPIKGRDLIPGQAELIRTARGNITQAELGERAGTGQSAISAIERGDRAPSARVIWEIAAALGCSIESLFPSHPGGNQSQKKISKKS